MTPTASSSVPRTTRGSKRSLPRPNYAYYGANETPDDSSDEYRDDGADEAVEADEAGEAEDTAMSARGGGRRGGRPTGSRWITEVGCKRGSRGGRGRSNRGGQGARAGRGGRQQPLLPQQPPSQPVPEPSPQPVSFDIAPYPPDARNAHQYAAPPKKWDRYRAPVSLLYGPDPHAVALLHALRWRWAAYPVLPRRPAAGAAGNADNADALEYWDKPDDAISDDNDDETNGIRTSASGGMLPSPWLVDYFEVGQAQAFRDWYRQSYAVPGGMARQQVHAISAATGRQFLAHTDANDGTGVGATAASTLVTLVGPVTDQQTVPFQPGMCRALHDTGLVLRGDDHAHNMMDADPTAGGARRTPAAWMLDAGGLVISMAWTPLAGHVDQLLALAVVPHSDYASKMKPPRGYGGSGNSGGVSQGGDKEEEEASRRRKKLSSVQFWRVPLGRRARSEPGSETETDIPRLERVCCFDWGRPKRMQWCPVPFVDDGLGEGDVASIYGLLAILTGDGTVRVVEVSRSPSDATDTQYEWIESPIATLGLDEYNVTATCLAWLGVNRLVVGHSDGSITLWSLRPHVVLLQRRPLHATAVLDLCSAYPSHPYLVASRPVGGVVRLVDLTRPGAEHTFHPTPAVQFQPDLLAWCELMQGFAAVAPSSNPLSAKLDFSHIRSFPSARAFFIGRPARAATCLAVGAVHPYVLVGSANGSVWSCNMLRKVFPDAQELVYRLKIFDSEFRPMPPASGSSGRGAVRILQGFVPELNEMQGSKANVAVAAAAAAADNDEEDGVDEDEDEDEGDGQGHDVNGQGTARGKTIVYEPLTRISALAWNPNIEYGWWAAAAMGSGLVRIMDLGVDPVR